MGNKDIFRNKIKEIVVPFIRSQNFKGSYPAFKKMDGDKIYFVNFQYGRNSLIGKVIVQLSIINLNKLSDWAKTIDVNKFNYGHSHKWHRLGSPAQGQDGIWFDYENNDPEKIAKQILELMKTELPEYLSKY